MNLRETTGLPTRDAGVGSSFGDSKNKRDFDEVAETLCLPNLTCHANTHGVVTTRYSDKERRKCIGDVPLAAGCGGNVGVVAFCCVLLTDWVACHKSRDGITKFTHTQVLVEVQLSASFCTVRLQPMRISTYLYLHLHLPVYN